MTGTPIDRPDLPPRPDASGSCRGTGILTDRGEVAVEALAIGDLVVTGSGSRPVKWIGRCSYAGRFLRGNPEVSPIIVKQGAFAEGVPHRDLWVAPHHALLLGDVLVPALRLVNGVSVLRGDELDTVGYFDIELDAHDIIYAEGAAIESFVDRDNRGVFHNADEFALLYPDEDPPRRTRCAPRIEEGEVLHEIRRKLAERLVPLGLATTSDPDLHLIVDGRVILPETVNGAAHGFRLSGRPNEIRIVSRSAVPRDIGMSTDIRRLGVSIWRIVLRGRGVSLEIAPDETSLVEGFHGAEFGHRWTDGNARLPHHFHNCLFGGFTIEIHAGGLPSYPVAATLPDDGARDRGRPAPVKAAPGRALFIDNSVPTPDRDAGSNAAIEHMRSLMRLGYAVTFVGADDMARISPYTEQLEAIGIKCCNAPQYSSVEAVFNSTTVPFDLIYLHRLANATKYLPMARQYFPVARIIYSVADLMYLRTARQATVEERPALIAESERLKDAELTAVRSADAVITHSSYEAQLLAQEAPEAQVHVIAWPVRARKRKVAPGERQGIALIAGYQHPPNIDAALWLVREIMPKVWERNPAIECLLVGSRMPDELRQLSRRGVLPLGHVDRLDGIFDRVRITVAPLRYGAGIKGKVIDSLAAGVPCVGTPIAAEGLDLPPPLRDCIGGTAEELADLISRLCHSNEDHQRYAKAGLRFVREAFSARRIDQLMRAAAGLGEPDASPRDRGGPGCA